jgi:hypothetical protein
MADGREQQQALELRRMFETAQSESFIIPRSQSKSIQLSTP